MNGERRAPFPVCSSGQAMLRSANSATRLAVLRIARGRSQASSEARDCHNLDWMSTHSAMQGTVLK